MMWASPNDVVPAKADTNEKIQVIRLGFFGDPYGNLNPNVRMKLAVKLYSVRRTYCLFRGAKQTGF